MSDHNVDHVIAILDAADAEGRPLDELELDQIGQLESAQGCRRFMQILRRERDLDQGASTPAIRAMRAELDREKKRLAKDPVIEKYISTHGIGRQTVPDQIGVPHEIRSENDHGPTRSKAPGTVGPRYSQMFPKRLGNDGWNGCEQFLSAVHEGLTDRRLQSQLSSEISGSDGGFLVPPQFAAEWLDASLESEIVRPRARIHPMTSATLKIAGFANQDNSGSAPFGGLSGTWLAELEEAIDLSPECRAIVLNARKLAIFSRASNELIADGQDFESMLGEAIVKSLSWHLDVAFLTGTGAGQPLGVLNDPALIVADKEIGQAAASIEYQNLVAMFARLHPSLVQGAVWVCSQTTIPELSTLTIDVGTGGNHIQALTESAGVFKLLTLPVVFTEKTPSIGSEGDILLANFSEYSVGLREGITLEKSNAVRWQTDESSYRSILRGDGFGRWAQAFTPLNGDTLSWCVTLEERT